MSGIINVYGTLRELYVHYHVFLAVPTVVFYTVHLLIVLFRRPEGNKAATLVHKQIWASVSLAFLCARVYIIQNNTEGFHYESTYGMEMDRLLLTTFTQSVFLDIPYYALSGTQNGADASFWMRKVVVPLSVLAQVLVHFEGRVPREELLTLFHWQLGYMLLDFISDVMSLLGATYDMGSSIVGVFAKALAMTAWLWHAVNAALVSSFDYSRYTVFLACIATFHYELNPITTAMIDEAKRDLLLSVKDKVT